MFEAGNKTLRSIAKSEFGGVQHNCAETYTMRLFTDVVDLDGDGTELTTGGYGEVEFDNDTTSFPLGTGNNSENVVVIQTNVFTEDSPAIRSAGFYDEDGDLRYRKVYPANTVYVVQGNVFRLSEGMLTFNPQ